MGGFRDFFTELLKKWIKEPIDRITDKIGESRFEFQKGNAIRIIERSEIGNPLKEWWESVPVHVKEAEEVKAAYKAKLDELDAQGMHTKADFALGKVGTGVAKAVIHITKKAYDNLMPIFEELMEEAKLSEQSRKNIRSIAGSGEFGLNAVITFLLGVTLHPAISVATAPVWENAGQEVAKVIDYRLLDEASLLRLLYREQITEEEFVNQLERKGYSDENIASLKKAYLYYPSPLELVNWQAKEVFEPGAVTKYGLLEEFENVNKEAFYKAGMDNVQIANFWKAHWIHPSFTQVVDMRRRGLIEDKDIWDWFKLVEIPPYWRNHLIELSHSFLTRVDLRRIWVLGDKSEEWLRKRMNNLGYFGEEEEEMVEFYQKYKLTHQKDLTESRILKGLRKGTISKEVCAEYLVVLGYSEDEADFIIQSEIYDQAQDDVEEEINAHIDRFVKGDIDKEGLIKALEGYHLTEKEIRFWAAKADSERRKIRKYPPEKTLTEWFSVGIIDTDTYKKRMRGLNYSAEDIERFVQAKVK